MSIPANSAARVLIGAIAIVIAIVAVAPAAVRAQHAADTATLARPAPAGDAPAGSAPRRKLPVFGPLKASAEVYSTYCAGCHGGLDGSVGRAPYLFNDRLLGGLSDPQLTRSIRDGIPKTEMIGFKKAVLSDEQLFSLITFLRTEAGFIKPKTQVVADPDGKVIRSEQQTFRIEVVARGLKTPWGMVFLPDGRLLVSERAGRLRLIDVRTGKVSAPIEGTPATRALQDGGYFDVSISPDYARDGWVYLAYAEELPGWKPTPAAIAELEKDAGYRRDLGPPEPANTVVVRARIRDGRWTGQQVLFRSPAALYSSSTEHYGLRFLWDGTGHLFFTLGERGDMKNAQTLTGDNGLGKIHRINADGSAPADNPFVGRPGVDPTIWSYGHRNPEGLALDPVSGLLWESEHGPVGGDEINVIRPGANYGWGVVSMGMQPGITGHTHPGMVDPVAYYTPSIAPTAISFYTGNRYPGWKDHSLFVCGLVGQQLRRLEVRGGKVIHQEVLFQQLGRVRDIVQGPDGYFYVALQSPTGVNGLDLSADTPGMIIKLVPADQTGRRRK